MLKMKFPGQSKAMGLESSCQDWNSHLSGPGGHLQGGKKNETKEQTDVLTILREVL